MSQRSLKTKPLPKAQDTDKLFDDRKEVWK